MALELELIGLPWHWLFQSIPAVCEGPRRASLVTMPLDWRRFKPQLERMPEPGADGAATQSAVRARLRHMCMPLLEHQCRLNMHVHADVLQGHKAAAGLRSPSWG